MFRKIFLRLKLNKINKRIKYCEQQKLSIESANKEYFIKNNLEDEWNKWNDMLRVLINRRDCLVNFL